MTTRDVKCDIENLTGNVLSLYDENLKHGKWVDVPAPQIENEKTGYFFAQKGTGTQYGAEGYVTYSTWDKSQIKVFFSNPMHGNNKAIISCSNDAGGNCNIFDFRFTQVPNKNGQPLQLKVQIKKRGVKN